MLFPTVVMLKPAMTHSAAGTRTPPHKTRADAVAVAIAVCDDDTVSMEVGELVAVVEADAEGDEEGEYVFALHEAVGVERDDIEAVEVRNDMVADADGVGRNDLVADADRVGSEEAVDERVADADRTAVHVAPLDVVAVEEARADRVALEEALSDAVLDCAAAPGRSERTNANAQSRWRTSGGLCAQVVRRAVAMTSRNLPPSC